MAACVGPVVSSATAALTGASFSLFLGALPLSTSPQGCFLSPLSIVYALALALNGAGPESLTHTELLRALSGTAVSNPPALTEADLNSELGRTMSLLNGQCAAGAQGDTSDPASRLILANSLWTGPGTQLKQTYVGAMESLYQATAREAVNGARDVNAWVAEVTRGIIKDLVHTDNFDAILANAIYFKGLWTHAFKPELTSGGDFTTPGGAPKQVQYMQQTFEHKEDVKHVVKEGSYEAVVLPYKGGTFSAVALLPAEGVDVGAAIQDWAAAGPIEELPRVDRLRVVLPKFKVTSEMSLTPVLQGLGVQAAFGGGADFSRMVDGPMHVSDVVHKAVVEVDEEGTVAAAATAVMMLRSMPLPPPELVFNRQFALIISHNPTGLPVFVGVVSDPSAPA